ncbi:hypothetical protein A2U01_0117212, partial [Trifolium medium]|nr:hypothetical protein [Trifolium medium]
MHNTSRPAKAGEIWRKKGREKSPSGDVGRNLASISLLV